MSRMLYGEDVYEVPNWNEEDPRLGWYPMQFTGLRDKNGKEIWEGDVVKVHEFGKFGAGALFMEMDKGDLFKVKWADARFSLVTLNIENESYPDMTINGVYEIIGNVHESPELLTPHN